MHGSTLQLNSTTIQYPHASMENKAHLICSEKKEAVLVCCGWDCHAEGLMCHDNTCQCRSLHHKCGDSHLLYTVVEQLFEKGKGTQRSMSKFANLNKIYESLLTKIALDHQEMGNKNPLLGLEQHEFELDEIIKGKKEGLITGKSIHRVVMSLNKMPTSVFEQVTGDEEFLSKIEHDIDASLLKLKTLWKFQVKHEEGPQVNVQVMKAREEELKLKKSLEGNVYWLEINGKQVQHLDVISDLKTITGIGLEKCDIKALELLGRHCKNLKNLGVHSDLQKFGDYEAATIALNLPFLTHLHLHDHNITDEGGVKIAQYLKDLVVLNLYGNKLTADADEDIKQLLPKCKSHITESQS